MSLFNRVYYFGMGKSYNEVVYYENGMWTQMEGKLLAGESHPQVKRYANKVFITETDISTTGTEIEMWEIKNPDVFSSMEISSDIYSAFFLYEMFIVDSSQINEEICKEEEDEPVTTTSGTTLYTTTWYPTTSTTFNTMPANIAAVLDLGGSRPGLPWSVNTRN